jgi:hypothetical protein
MGLHSYANQRDRNEKPIVEVFERLGASVWRTDTPCDLIVGDVVKVPALAVMILKEHEEARVGGLCLACGDTWPCDAFRAAKIIERMAGPRTHLVEVKFGHAKLTPHQVLFEAHHKGDFSIAREPEDAADLVAAWRNSAIFSKGCR